MEHAPDNPQPLLGEAEPWYMRWRGVFATIVVIAVLETITRAFQVSIGSKNAFAALGVVYSAFVGGLAPGLVSTTIQLPTRGSCCPMARRCSASSPMTGAAC